MTHRLGTYRILLCTALAAAWGAFARDAGAGVVFNLTYASGMDSQAVAAFQQAADRWSAILDNPITVNINIAFSPLSGQTLGSTNTIKQLSTYTAFQTALASHATSADDARAVASLPAGASFGMLINRTYENPNGIGSAIPYLDNNESINNSYIRMTTANAKVLGLRAANDSRTDASITFSSSYAWDFNPADGIDPAARDFVGAATHEIGHALGFVSGVPMLDSGGLYNEDFYNYVAPIDLFRFSADSTAEGVIDWTADTRAKYFSLDGGATSLGGFATGTKYGDGRDASHWKEAIAPDLPLGILDPTLALGELMTIAPLDEQAFDVLGYTVVPEPASMAAVLGAWVFLCRRKAGRRVSAA